MNGLTHVNAKGQLTMVNVSDKCVSHRFARATGLIKLRPETTALIEAGKLAKGNVSTAAELAGIQAAKRTAELIPLCHNLALTNVIVRVEFRHEGAWATAEVNSTGQTGVEMEALVAVSTALLTIYDMCKAVDHTMEITGIRLSQKTKHKA